jgi:hypothetical protein
MPPAGLPQVNEAPSGEDAEDAEDGEVMDSSPAPAPAPTPQSPLPRINVPSPQPSSSGMHTPKGQPPSTAPSIRPGGSSEGALRVVSDSKPDADGWMLGYSRRENRPYFYNVNTRTSKWEPPPGYAPFSVYDLVKLFNLPPPSEGERKEPVPQDRR